MSNISMFQKILEQAGGTVGPPAPKVIWISAATRGAGLYVYHIGIKGWPLARLFTFNLADAREAAEQLGAITGRVVKEAGPPEAFNKKRDIYAPSCRPAESTIDAFWVVVGRGDQEQLDVWLARHPNDAPFLSRLLIAGRE